MNKSERLNDTNGLIQRYKQSKFTLGVIFDAEPESYTGVDISELGLDNRELSALRRHKSREQFPVADLLMMTIADLNQIRNFGYRGLIEVLKHLQLFLNNYEPQYTHNETIYKEQDINIYRLDRALRLLMRGESVDDIELRESEIPYVEKFKKATSVIDKVIYVKAYRNDAHIEDLMNFLFRASNELVMLIKYRRELERTFYKISPDTRNKSAINFVRAYFMKNERLHYDYLTEISKNLTLNDFYREIIKQPRISYSLYKILIDFFSWLDFDLKQIADEIIGTLTKRLPDREIFAQRALGLNRGIAMEKYKLTKSKLYSLEVHVANEFYKAYKNHKYDFFVMLYAFRDNGLHNITVDDLKSVMSDEYAELVWYALKLRKNYFRTELYSYRGYREVLGDRITMGVWFYD